MTNRSNSSFFGQCCDHIWECYCMFFQHDGTVYTVPFSLFNTVYIGTSYITFADRYKCNRRNNVVYQRKTFPWSFSKTKKIIFFFFCIQISHLYRQKYHSRLVLCHFYIFISIWSFFANYHYLSIKPTYSTREYLF